MHKHNRFSQLLIPLFCLIPLMLSACGGGGESAGNPSPPPPSTPAPTLSLSASPTSLTAGASSTITWSTTNATGCTATGGWSGAKAASGTEAVSPSATATYTLACTGAGGNVSRDATVTVTPLPPANTAPTAVASTSPRAQGGGRIVLRVTATDKEGGTLTYFWTQTSGPIGAVFEDSSASSTLVTLPKTNGVENISFEVKVTDSGSLSGFATATVEVSTGFIVLTPTAPPAGVPGANPFFGKYLDAGGIPVLASSRVADRALAWPRHEGLEMLKWRPDVAAAMVNRNVFIVVLGQSEEITDIPGVPADIYERIGRPRTQPLRGLTQGRMTIVAEENLLCLQGNLYPKESIFVHEFLHLIDLHGMEVVEPGFRANMLAHFNTVRNAGLWNNTYFGTNQDEWRAGGATDWYDVNMESILGDTVHNFVNTRVELETYDTILYGDLEKVFSKDTLSLCPP